MSKIKTILTKRWLRVPVWVWLVSLWAITLVAGQSSSESGDGAPTTTIREFRFKESNDPIKNLLYQAEQANPNLQGWTFIDDVYTDDDLVFDDIRIDVTDDVDYQSESDASALIDMSLAIQKLAQSPIQIDVRIDVRHSEVQPDGSITTEMRRREWIEVTGDSKGAGVSVDVYGFLPAEKNRLEGIEKALQSKYPDVWVKITDTSLFDD